MLPLLSLTPSIGAPNDAIDDGSVKLRRGEPPASAENDAAESLMGEIDTILRGYDSGDTPVSLVVLNELNDEALTLVLTRKLSPGMQRRLESSAFMASM